MGSWVALEWKLLRGGRLWWQDWSWLWQGLCERLTPGDLQMQRESLSRRSCCSAVCVSLIAQLFGNRCVLGAQTGTVGHRGACLTVQQKTRRLGRFSQSCRGALGAEVLCKDCLNPQLLWKAQHGSAMFFTLDVSVHFMCLVVFLAQGQAEIHDHGVLPLSLLSSGFPSALPKQLRKPGIFPGTDHLLEHLQPLVSLS